MKIIEKENLEKKYSSELASIDNYLRKLKIYKRQQDILEVINMLNENPNLTEEMIRPDLKKTFGIAKREYKKQIIQKSSSKLR